jgi:glycosyltransferase involved in cell wall biosynthesis
MRLGVYSDLKYRRDEGGLSTDRAFIRFVTSLPPRVDEVVIFGRLDPVRGRYPYALPEEGVRFVPLPFYPNVTAIRGLVGAVRRSTAIFRSELDRLDAVWIFGPHPLADRFARIARRHGTPLVLGVRQDYPSYIAARLPGPSWRWAIPVAHGLERSFRRLARSAPTVALGAEISRNYSGGDAPVLTTGFSLVRGDELVSDEEALAKTWDGTLRVLSVGRLDPEKNPLLLLDIAELLRGGDRRWSLGIAGDGPLRDAVEEQIAERGLAETVELLGYVPNGPRLWAEYRRSHAFLHVSLTEGLPQVLFEAQGAGLPVVATDVGGVSAAVGDGESALLMPPSDAPAAAAALTRVADDEAERRRLIVAGLANAREQTLEAQLDRIAEFLRAAVEAGAPSSDAA